MCIYALMTGDASIACWNWCWIEPSASDRHLSRKVKIGISQNPVPDQGLNDSNATPLLIRPDQSLCSMMKSTLVK